MISYEFQKQVTRAGRTTAHKLYRRRATSITSLEATERSVLRRFAIFGRCVLDALLPALPRRLIASPEALRLLAGDVEAGADLGETGSGDAVLRGELAHRRRPDLMIKLFAAERDRLAARLFGHGRISIETSTCSDRRRARSAVVGHAKNSVFCYPGCYPAADSAKIRA
jgi:hypothetical protein